MAPSILLLYHFFFPDDVASAVHMYQFAQELVRRGWQVTVLTTNRYCREPGRDIPCREEYVRGIRIIRLYRPAWDQASPLGRMLNSAWVMGGWLAKLLCLPRFDVVLIGSDPAFAPLLLPLVRWTRKATILAHWCYDLYPEAGVAAGDGRLPSPLVTFMRLLMRQSYRAAHLIVDVGPCMRERLQVYGYRAHEATLVPWALVEPEQIKPPDPVIRQELFGNATLGLLYSGTLGHAHDYKMFIKLARLLRQKAPHVRLCFSCRGNKVHKFKEVLTPEDTNITLVDFVAEDMLEDHLNAADFHLISLKQEWSGVVVPSKFFGSLAVGKPVIYAGPEHSAIATWIREHKIGFHLTENSLEDASRMLDSLSYNASNIGLLRKRAFAVYHGYFSKKVVVDEWDHLLRRALSHNKQEV